MDDHSIKPIVIRFHLVPGREPFYKLKGFKIGVAVAGLVAVVAFFHSNPKVSKWQPPELPTNTVLITVGFGGNFFSNPVGWFDGTNSVGVAGSTHGFPFNVRVKNRRIFVEAITLDDTRQDVSISDEVDYRLPLKWDRNFTTNVFEIVDATTNPVFQVIYDRPNQVTINGIFSLPDGGLIIAFNGSVFYSKRGLEKVDGAPQLIPRKPLFKYPYWKYPGQFQQ